MSRQGWIRWLGSVLGVLCLSVASAHAQTGTAALQGVVLDAQKAAVPGATVTLTNADTGLIRVTATSENGSYQFTALRPGPNHEVKVELAGFKTAVRNKLMLTVDTTSRLDVALEIGSLSDAIQVTAEAPALNTSDASLGNVISGNQIRSLPLEAQNPVGLLSLQAGVVYVPVSTPTSVDPRYGSVSGARADQSNVTLDGIDVNDAQNQAAFTSVLRVTLDAVEEFRVTTSNYGADQGRSSGAQVSLITRSGTNNYRGSGYYVNRNTRFSSNEYFQKLSQLRGGNESVPPKLDKNIYGGSFGGPIKQNKLFFFGNFEGLKEQSETPVTRSVPSNSFRDGVLIYRCATASQCPGGTVQGFTRSHTVPAGNFGMTPADVVRVDPLHIGPSQFGRTYFNQYPAPTDPGLDGVNIMDFKFAAPIENTFRTYIGKVDYRLNGNHSLFGRINYQDDAIVSAPQFPGQPANSTREVKNRGVALGWDAVLRPNLINAVRFGYTLIDDATLGLQTTSVNSFRFINQFNALTSTNGRELGAYNIVNDMSWIKGDHSLKFGANLRFVRNDTFTNANSFHNGGINPSWALGVGRRYMPGGTCPAPADCSGLPAVASGGQAGYADAFLNLLGTITQASARYNYGIDGSVIPSGASVTRLFAADEYEFYAQDSWKLSNSLTVTAGLRYSLFSPPYEANGVQVAPQVSLGEWFDDRVEGMERGIPSNASPLMTYGPSGPVNGGRGFYAWDKNNVAPRAAVAWTPSDRWVVRGGYSLVYDRVGAGLATAFDSGGSFGLATSLSSPVNRNNETTPEIRVTAIDVLPPSLPAAPPAGFPASPAEDAGLISQSMDDTITTPYSHVYNAVVGFNLSNNYVFEAAYVGRAGRDLLIRRDISMPLNLTDPRSGVDYFTAARQIIDAINAAGGDPTRVGRIPYWENLFPDAAGGGLSATQNIAAEFYGNAPDHTTTLWAMDQACFPACSIFGPYAYFARQFDALAVHSSLARANYNALQLSLRKRYSNGHQFDLNYTFGVSKDHASSVERGSVFGNFGSGGYSGFMINSFDLEGQYGYSDFDVRHQINVNGLYELPFGQGRRFASDVGGLTNALVGDWSLAGIFRWTSGFPFNVLNCRSCWPTNWNLQGNAELVNPDRLPETETTRNAVDRFPSPFANAQDALTFFRRAYPGEQGIRNLLRGDGYFVIDLGLSKSVNLWANHRLRFRWDVFNLTNTVRFNTGNVTMQPDRATTFGRYDGALSTCDGQAGRCMQFNLKYEF